MERKEFFEAIKDDFFEERSAELEDFKSMVRGAMPVFGELETVIEDADEGGRTITFIDRHEADLIFHPKGVNIDDVNTDMSSTLMTLTLDDNGVIKTVSHGIMGLFTPANKDQALLLASFIGKKIEF